MLSGQPFEDLSLSFFGIPYFEQGLQCLACVNSCYKQLKPAYTNASGNFHVCIRSSEHVSDADADIEGICLVK